MAKKGWMSEDLGEGRSRRRKQQMQKLRGGAVSTNSRNYCACIESCGAPEWWMSMVGEYFWLQVRGDSKWLYGKEMDCATQREPKG